MTRDKKKRTDGNEKEQNNERTDSNEKEQNNERTDGNEKEQNNEGSNSTTRPEIGKITSPIINPTTIGAISGAAGGEKTSSKTGSKTGSTTGSTTSSTTSSTTGAATGGTTSSILDSLTVDEITKLRLIIGAIGDLNVAKLSLIGLATNETDRVYYDNRLKPLVDAAYNIGVAVASIASAANIYQGNTYSEKHEIKKALDITYELNDSMEIVARILKCRLEYYERNSDWCK